jgi:hypothetical protein
MHEHGFDRYRRLKSLADKHRIPAADMVFLANWFREPNFLNQPIGDRKHFSESLPHPIGSVTGHPNRRRVTGISAGLPAIAAAPVAPPLTVTRLNSLNHVA